jgi:hypothetical protein
MYAFSCACVCDSAGRHGALNGQQLAAALPTEDALWGGYRHALWGAMAAPPKKPFAVNGVMSWGAQCADHVAARCQVELSLVQDGTCDLVAAACAHVFATLVMLGSCQLLVLTESFKHF